MSWIVAYDITSPRRWRRIHARISRVGFRLQYSLYWLPISGPAGHALADEIAGLIDPRSDDVRFYPFPDNAWARFYGVPPWTEGVHDALYRRFGDCWRESPDDG